MKPDENNKLSIDDQMALLEQWPLLLERLQIRYSKQYKSKITDENIQDALFILLEESKNLEWQPDLWDLQLTYEEACLLLDKFDFTTFQQTLCYDADIPYQFVMLQKGRFKHKGQIWVIHKNDPDPFPSNPHAHDLQNRIKLDLSNGDCYKRNQVIHRIRKKDLLEIRVLASKVYSGLLPKLTSDLIEL